ncbi:glutathione S-transferase Mu 1-like [Lingula anatina]|uniref:glutathione transferase n=1 Tax=Lingula anatina TaxID=7574 RepID=A0A1S3I2N9_LINAN|nr:glutathione S-transferase Mu 1-like [Lingula anatina]|eukprot:XP_013392091.1 glutathione S-transferase Mu 1-like [Lingula anatina]
MPALLGYWNIRRLAQPIRLMLAYAGEEVEERRYQIPYYKDGDTIIVQSRAIMMHLARKHNLCGSTEAERIRADVIASQFYDTFKSFTQVCLATYVYKIDYKTKKEEFLKSLPDTLKSYSDFLGDNPWVGGNNITYADFNVYEMLDWFKMFSPGCLVKFPNLIAYCKNFEALPAIKKYMASAQFLKTPVWTPYADWNA